MPQQHEQREEAELRMLDSLKSRAEADSIEQQRSRTDWQSSPTTGRGFGAGLRAGALTGVFGGIVMGVWHWRSTRVVLHANDYHSLKPPISASGKVWLVTAAALAAFFVASEQAVVGTEARDLAAKDASRQHASQHNVRR